MISANDLETRKCVANNKNLFEDVSKSYVNAKEIYRTQYSVLNYDMILDQMIEFVDGYKQYADSDKHDYDGKVLRISQKFYDNMFTDKKYRKVINLEQYKEMNTSYLKKTKTLQTIIETYLKDKTISAEMDSLIRLTNNQYKKLAKVCRDDMKIYLWLTTSGSKFFAYHLDEGTRSQYANKKAPVMHKHVPK